MTVANTSAVLGFTNDFASDTRQFVQGMDVGANGTVYTYAVAAADIAAAGTVALTGAFGATTTTSGSTHTHDVPAPGVKSGQYFWAKIVAAPI